MGEQKEKPLNELLSRDMVDIYVGSENTHWILHEKLLCYRSKFFRNIFYNKEKNNHAMGLPDEDDEPFRLFVAWLYSATVPTPKEEKDLGTLFDLYLMGEKWAIKGLMMNVLDAVRNFYHLNDSYPGLRRVQYVYANSEQESPMRQLLVGSIARYLVLGNGIPAHWDKALRKNGQLAVDIIMAVQKWKLEEESVPDPREESVVPIYEEAEKTSWGDKEAAKEEGKEAPEEAPKEEEADEGDKEVKQEEDEEQQLPNGTDGPNGASESEQE